MNEISYEKLFNIMRSNRISKTELTHMAGISTNMMAKLGKNESVQISVLCKICKALNCQLSDIVDFIEK